jgi:hypothetical protein
MLIGRSCGVLVLGILLAGTMTCSTAGRKSSAGAGGSAGSDLTGTLSEEQKIDALIESIARLPDAQFIRKGVTYDGVTAARFLRGKREAFKDQVKTARDFVVMASGGNMGTGSPYYIKFADGRVVSSRELLTAELARLENREVVQNRAN